MTEHFDRFLAWTRRNWFRLCVASAAFVRAWKDPERAAIEAVGGSTEPPRQDGRFRVVRWHEDGREVLVNEGGNGAKARRDYEWSCTLPGVRRVEFLDNGVRRGVWER